MAETKTKAMSLREKLMRIQVELKAPKNLYNSFGKYKYRNAEGIQEALKPMEKTYNVTTILTDEMIELSGRVYVKAIATIMDCETEEMISTTAYAREADAKKGMDEAQVTGATSSYARKYALNALYLLDDTKDVVINPGRTYSVNIFEYVGVGRLSSGIYTQGIMCFRNTVQ